jgi:hypothetical protein
VKRFEEVKFVDDAMPVAFRKIAEDPRTLYLAVYGPDPSRYPGERLLGHLAWSRKRGEAIYAPLDKWPRRILLRSAEKAAKMASAWLRR